MPDRAPLGAGGLLVDDGQRAPADDATLVASERFNRTPLRQAELGLAAAAAGGMADDDPALGPLGHRIAAVARATDWPFVRAMRSLLAAAERCRSPMLNEVCFVDALARLAVAWRAWRRHPDDWDPRAPDARWQFGRLARHLMADYPVPWFFDAGWLHDATCATVQRQWFIHVGTGHNLRTAGGLPFPLTKAMAHHAMLAPRDLPIFHALRWGQVLGLGGGEPLARAVIASRLRAAAPAAHEPFWLTVIQFMAAHPAIEPNQVGPIIDYLHHQRFDPAARIVDGAVVADGCPAQPAFSMKGRTVESLMRQVERWHARLSRDAAGVGLDWAPSGIPGFERVDGVPPEQRLFTVTELLSGEELWEEGLKLAHCVGSYARACKRGRCAVFSLRVDSGRGPARRLTVEVTLPARTIVQARGRRNRQPDGTEDQVLRAWAAYAGLEIADWTFRL
jgi:hypothetical protein